jgi:site-specific DNA recombinase
VDLLTRLDVSGAPRAATALSVAEQAAISADEVELAELKDMWTHREISTREYRQMRKTIEDRISALHRKTIVRPTAEVLTGLVGPDARTVWNQLADRGEVERLNAVLRFLFVAVIIDEHRGARGSFDYSRIDIEPNPLLTVCAPIRLGHGGRVMPLIAGGGPVTTRGKPVTARHSAVTGSAVSCDGLIAALSWGDS